MSTHKNYRHVLENMLGIPFYKGNQIKVLKNGVEIFPAMLQAIQEAKHQVDFLTFVYWTGNIADRFAKELAKKAEEGVRVRVILDSYGAAFMPSELVGLMEKKGVDVRWFRPLARWKIWETDNRTHRKVLICDGHIAFTGGVGIAEEWEGDARDPSEWRETYFKIEGRAVRGLQAAFMENWIETKDILPVDTHFSEPTDEIASNSTLVQVIRTAASVRWSDIVMLYQVLIQIAETRIRISTAYFNPNEVMVKLLVEAVERGVDVHIMMPGDHTDQRVAKVAGEDKFEELLDGGVKLSYYQKTMLHAKIILIDDTVCCIGSANFNHRSMIKDDEINLVVIDETLAGTLNGHFEEDLKSAEKVNKERWKRRSIFRRGAEKITTIFKEQI